MTTEIGRKPEPGHDGVDVPSPPLFTRLWSDIGVHSFVAERNAAVDLDMRLDWQCEVRAPGGGAAQGWLRASDGGDPKLVYDRILALFGSSDPANLWFTRGSSLAVEDPTLPECRIGIWNGSGEPVPELDFVIRDHARHPYALVAEVKGTRLSYVETPDGEGRPAFAVLRAEDLLVFDVHAKPDGTELLPRVFAKPGYHTAYWAFARAGLHEAAVAIARKLVEVATGDGWQSEEDLLATAHALLRFRELWTVEPQISRRLASLSASFDASLTHWVISYEKGDDSAFTSLPQLLERFDSEKPAFAETFRLFYSRLRPAVRRADADGPMRDRLARAELAVDRLAASSYLDGEHLIFRGRSPVSPDPKATTTDISAQKKTFRRRPQGRSGPVPRRPS